MARRTVFLSGVAAGFAVAATASTLLYLANLAIARHKRRARRRQDHLLDWDDEQDDEQIQLRSDDVVEGVEGLIGKTPLLRIQSLSRLLGVDVLGKCEFTNPFGSVKDRVSLMIVNEAERQGLLAPRPRRRASARAGSAAATRTATRDTIFEGTSGSTGISLAGIASARGYDAHIVMSDDVSQDKVNLLTALGATVERVRPVSFVDKRHYVNLARTRATEFGERTLVAASASAPASSSAMPSVSATAKAEDMSLASPLAGTQAERADVHDASILVSAQQDPPAQLVRRPVRCNDNEEGQEEEEPAAHAPRALFADQFETPLNHLAHYSSTGPEIWRQTCARLDAFVAGAGTAGTLGGVGRYLKERSRAARTKAAKGGKKSSSKRLAAATAGEQDEVEVVLADPEGSGIYHKVLDGVMWAQTEEEGKRRRHQIDSVVEGIGLNRVTRNLELALPFIDDAIRVTDQEAVAMSRFVASRDGLFLGSSSAVNLVAVCKLVRKRGWQQPDGGSGGGNKRRVVTILCDGGARHLSRFWNDEYLAANGIAVSDSIDEILHGEL